MNASEEYEKLRSNLERAIKERDNLKIEVDTARQEVITQRREIQKLSELLRRAETIAQLARAESQHLRQKLKQAERRTLGTEQISSGQSNT